MSAQNFNIRPTPFNVILKQTFCCWISTMDKQLEQRWKNGKPPFNGQCIRLIDHIQLPTLRILLHTIVDVLYRRTKHCTLFRFDDWHEHDGYVTEALPTDWSTLDQILMNDQKLHESRHGDMYVRWAYYPDNLSFLLRYDILDPDEEVELSEPYGDCDLCADEDTIREIRSKAGNVVDCLEICCAKEYFDEIYAG